MIAWLIVGLWAAFLVGLVAGMWLCGLLTAAKLADVKLMLRFSNTSPKVTMKRDARSELWIEAASRLLGVFLGITDYLIAARGLDKKFRTLSKSENEFLYEIFKTRAGKDVAAIDPFPVAEYLAVPSLKEALHKDL